MRQTINTNNDYLVGANVNGEVSIANPPTGWMTKDHALRLAAYIVLMADPTEERFEEIKEAVAAT